MKRSPKLLTLNIYTEPDQYEKEKLDCEYWWIGSSFSPPRKPQTNPKTKHLLQNELLKAFGIGSILQTEEEEQPGLEDSETPNVSFAGVLSLPAEWGDRARGTQTRQIQIASKT